MGYVLDDYVVSGYVQGYSVTITGVSASFAIPNIIAHNVEATIAKPLGVSVNTAVKIKTILDSVAPITGVKATTKLGDCYVTVRHPGMSIDFIQFTPPKLLPNPTHNNAGEAIGGLFSYLNPIPEPLYSNLTGAEGNLTHTLPYYSAPLSYIYNEEVQSIWGYQVTTLPSDREMAYGSIQEDKVLELIIYNKRLDSISLAALPPSNFGLYVDGLDVGQSIPGNSQIKINLWAVHLLGDREITGWCPLYFDKITLWLYVSVKRQPVNTLVLVPDKNTYRESYQFKTNVFTSSTRKEKRTILMSYPKASMSYQITHTSPQLATLAQNYIYMGLYNKTLIHPVWAFSTKLTKDLESDINIFCDTYQEFNIFKIGDFCGILLNNSEILYTKIIEVNPTYLVIADQISAPTGTLVLPTKKCKPGTSTALRNTIATDQTMQVTMMEII